MSRFDKIGSHSPAFNEGVLDSLESVIYDKPAHERMTIGGTMAKIGILMSILLLAAGFNFYMAVTGNPMATMLTWGGMGVGFILVFVISFKKHLSPTLSPVYAVAEGLFIGGISAMYASMFDGIIIQAAGLTLGTVVVMLVIYRTGLIKVTEKFKSVMYMLIGAIMLYYVASFLLSFLGIHISHFHHSGPIAMVVCMGIIVIAALSLLLDFDLIEKCTSAQAPKYMEWYASFGILVTIIWLYIEFLRLLSLFAGSD